MLAEALDAGGLAPIVPQGAYYMLADATSLGCSTSKDASMALLEKAKVASIAGSAFYRGDTGERLLRFCLRQGRRRAGRGEQAHSRSLNALMKVPALALLEWAHGCAASMIASCLNSYKKQS